MTDLRSKSTYLANKRSGLKEQAFQYLQSRSQYNEDLKTPQMLPQSRPRTRSTNAADRHIDMIRHPGAADHTNRYSDSRISSSTSDIHRSDYLRQSSSDYRSESRGYSADPALRVPIPGSYKPRPRSIATDIGYSSRYTDGGPLSPEYDYRSSSSNLLYGGPIQSGYRDSDPHSEGRKWGSCSRLEYSNTPPQHHFPLSHERTDGDGGPASYNSSDLPYTNQYRRHSSSKMSSHSGSTHSDDVTLQQQLDEKNRVIDSLKMRVSEQDLRLADLRITDRALSEKSGEHGAVAESLDSGIDIRSETGGMKPLFSSTAQRTQTSNERIDQRNEISRLKLHIQQLENRFPEHVEDETEKLLCKINDLIKENREIVEEKTSINRKFSRLQDYLTTLPTVNEYNSLKERLNQLTEENKKLQEETKKTSNATKDSKQKETDLKKYQKKCNDMRDTISKLEKQNQTLKSQNASQAKQELQKLEQERSKMDKKVEALRKEISVLSEQKETAKNMVGGYYEKYNNEHETNKILTESLDRSRVELDQMQSTIDTDKDEIKALKAQVENANTELEKCEEKLREYETKESLEPSELDYLKMLLSEFNGALQDLNNVVEVCQMYVHGERPNISLLLGLGSSPQLDDTAELSFRDKLEYVKELRSNIECLRTYLSEIYAVEVGRQCPTQ